MDIPTRLPRTTDVPLAESAASGTIAASAPTRQQRLGALRAVPWPDFATVVGLVAGWRVATWLFALLVASSAALPGLFPPADAADFFARVLLQGEAFWHVWIAQGGYAVAAHGPNSAAFPPLFALLIRFVALLTPSWPLAGALAAHAALLGALTYLVALVRLDADRDTGLRAIAAALLWPAAPFLGAAYPESTLLLTITAALYHARRGQWARAGFWAVLAGLTRGIGLLVVIPLLIEWRAQGAVRAAYPPRQRLIGLLAVLAAPLGFLGFLAFLDWQVGSLWAYFDAQTALGPGSLYNPLGLNTLRDLPAVLNRIAPAVRGYPRGILPFQVLTTIDVAALVVAAIAGFWLVLRVRRSYGLFVLAGVVAVVLVNGLPGSARHLIFLAPLYLALGTWSRRPIGGYLAAMLGLALVALTLFLVVDGFWAG